MGKGIGSSGKVAKSAVRIGWVATIIVVSAVGCAGSPANGPAPPTPPLPPVTSPPLTAPTLAALTLAGPTPAVTAVQIVRAYDASEDEYPEGIAVDAMGNIFASLARLGQVRRIEPDGTESTIMDLGEPKTLGLAVDGSGSLYVCQNSPGMAIHGIYRIDADGTSARLPGTEEMANPNGLALDERGNVYVTDSQLGALWRIPPGGPAELWLQHVLLEGTDETPGYPPIGANGVACWKEGLYVANLEQGHVVRIEILKGGEAGEPQVVADGRYGLDGIAVDNYGRIYAALGIQSKVIWIDPSKGEITELATRSDGLDIPASLAFGTTEGERESLYITNYAVTSSSSHPGILKLDVGVPGPPLP